MIEAAASKTAAGPKIIEISEDGSFEIPEEPPSLASSLDEPPALEASDGPPDLDEPSALAGGGPGGGAAAALVEDAGPSVMDEMMAAAEAARKVGKE